jgi:hypothetical protein
MGVADGAANHVGHIFAQRDFMAMFSLIDAAGDLIPLRRSDAVLSTDRYALVGFGADPRSNLLEVICV